MMKRTVNFYHRLCISLQVYLEHYRILISFWGTAFPPKYFFGERRFPWLLHWWCNEDVTYARWAHTTLERYLHTWYQNHQYSDIIVTLVQYSTTPDISTHKSFTNSIRSQISGNKITKTSAFQLILQRNQLNYYRSRVIISKFIIHDVSQLQWKTGRKHQVTAKSVYKQSEKMQETAVDMKFQLKTRQCYYTQKQMDKPP